ncbi:MBL fold metallo-hydrolase [Devosia sp. 2618]|uniref:MBL fold metallo-hydrolase n=1 Tax=Devosia sp. 2618 TaxID=3156454 RepID=UPI00339B2DF6
MGRDRTALIDSGLYAGYPSLERGSEELGLKLVDLDMLLLTHEHMDHVGNNGAIKRASGCTIVGHKAPSCPAKTRARSQPSSRITITGVTMRGWTT